MRLFGVSCLNSIGYPDVYKGGGGAFTWFAPTSPVCRVLGPLGRARPGSGSGTTVRPAAGQGGPVAGACGPWSPVTAGVGVGLFLTRPAPPCPRGGGALG